MSRGRGSVRVEPVKRLLIVSALSALVGGCGLGTGLDVRAYKTCLSRHPHDAVVCEGPRQAYEADPPVVPARSAGGVPAAGHGYEQRSATNPPVTPVLLHPGPVPVTSGPNG